MVALKTDPEESTPAVYACAHGKVFVWIYREWRRWWCEMWVRQMYKLNSETGDQIWKTKCPPARTQRPTLPHYATLLPIVSLPPSPFVLFLDLFYFRT